MRTSKKVSVISLFIIGLVFHANCQNHDLMKREYKNCGEAFEMAQKNVREDSKYWYAMPLKSGHSSISIKMKVQFDSVMKIKFNIKVLRLGGMSYDYTQNCYDKYIMEHMDTIYAQLFIIEAFNIVNLLNGKELEPWEKKIKATL